MRQLIHARLRRPNFFRACPVNPREWVECPVCGQAIGADARQIFIDAFLDVHAKKHTKGKK